MSNKNKNIKDESKDIVKCPECSRILGIDFLYCPYCKTNLKDNHIEKTLSGVENIISDPEQLTSAQLSIIYKIYQENNNASDHPDIAHLLEDKICLKFIRSISESEYTVKEMIVIAKKILILVRLNYERKY